MIYNYRHSRLRRVSENAFRIDNIVAIIIRATLALHNLLCTKSAEFYSPSGFADEVAQDGDQSLLLRWELRTQCVMMEIDL